METGYIKVAAATPNIKVADCKHNYKAITEAIDEACQKNAKIIVLPELCVTGYTCNDLFLQQTLLKNAYETAEQIAKDSQNKDILIAVGFPFVYLSKLYNVAAIIYGGEILCLIPKTYIPNYSEFYEVRHFNSGPKKAVMVTMGGKNIPFGTDIIVSAKNVCGLNIAVEICEDLWVSLPPSTNHALNGASVILNLSASDENTGKESYRRSLVLNQSARLYSAYVYTSAGDGESTTDLVFSGHNIIAENGVLLKESERFKNQIIYADIDLQKIAAERLKTTTYNVCAQSDYTVLEFEYKKIESSEASYVLDRYIDKAPFVPSDERLRSKRCDEILNIQAYGLKKRLEHTNAKTAVVAISGGLDSTLALLVTARAFDLLGKDRKDIVAVTMPGFGTTDRTYDNAVSMIKCIGATFKEINICDAVTEHLKLIEHDIDTHDVTYENAQARQRTYIIMDIANKTGGMVIGTGDLSELALGWATYNGDHMSMYAVNCSVPKTLVRHLVKYYADTCNDDKLRDVLMDVLDTPVSPELIPPKDGDIVQKTEDLVGPYELHDFYLYHMMRFGFSPSKIYYIAKIAFKGEYGDETILKWLKMFYRRFFSQQFKRSCIPDGPKVGSVALSPRGDLRMPSDAVSKGWLDELERLGNL